MLIPAARTLLYSTASLQIVYVLHSIIDWLSLSQKVEVEFADRLLYVTVKFIAVNFSIIKYDTLSTVHCSQISLIACEK